VGNTDFATWELMTFTQEITGDRKTQACTRRNYWQNQRWQQICEFHWLCANRGLEVLWTNWDGFQSITLI